MGNGGTRSMDPSERGHVSFSRGCCTRWQPGWLLVTGEHWWATFISPGDVRCGGNMAVGPASPAEAGPPPGDQVAPPSASESRSCSTAAADAGRYCQPQRVNNQNFGKLFQGTPPGYGRFLPFMGWSCPRKPGDGPQVIHGILPSPSLEEINCNS